ncbi:MAG: alpha/beta fold hydrolase [Dehalococcoidia bacterium]|nr:alpha/beta fold hydrolase [Dehalococcoidia bacterium]
MYRFEDFVLDTDRHELRRAGSLVGVEPQVFSVLQYLLEHPDRVARKEDLLAAVWGTTFISDAALATRIKEARRALADDGRAQRLIRTVHRVGYRFVGTLRTDRGVETEAPTPSRSGQVRFCRSADGVSIAMATTGDGPPFVKAANWLTHLEYDEQSPVWRHLIRELSRDHTLVRYDERGCGLSDRELDDESFGLEAWVRDLETVVDGLNLERFPLLGISQGGAVAVAYAVAHPERVSHLVLHGAYARGRIYRGAGQEELNQALVALTSHGWGEADSAHAQVFAARLIPRGTPEQVRWLVDLQRISASRQNAVLFRRAFGQLNVEALLPRVVTPTLVLHSRRDQAPPFEEGRRLAAGIPGARLVPLDTDNHLVLEDEPAWPHMLAEIREFVGLEAGALATR